VAQPLQEADYRFAGLRKQSVVITGDEQGDVQTTTSVTGELSLTSAVYAERRLGGYSNQKLYYLMN
jgi:hypothetical protein